MNRMLRPTLTIVRPVLALSLAGLLFTQSSLALAAPGLRLPAVNAPAEEQGLQITILDGEGALNNIRQRTAREPIVQVEDKNHKPVAGALVLFAINETNGAGATVNGATTFRTVTDQQGRAVMHGYAPNSTAGKFTLTVTATIGPLTTYVIMHQQNLTSFGQDTYTGPHAPVQHGLLHIVPHSPVLSGVVIGGIVVIAVTVIVVAATRGSGGARIAAGAGTVTAP